MRLSGLSRVGVSLWIIAGIAPRAVLGQQTLSESQQAGALKLEDFRLSGPPALSLLGIAAAAVARPNTPRDLIVSLVSAAGSEGLVPSGYALETTPFWLVRHPTLELREYYAASLVNRLRYFTSFSAATSRPSSRSDTVVPDAHVAIAIRTLLANGRPNPLLITATESMRELQLSYITQFLRWETAKSSASGLDARRRRLQREEELLSTLTTRVLVGGASALRDSTLRTLARRDSARSLVAVGEAAELEAARLTEELDGVERKLATLAKSISEEDLEPDGLVLEVAAGTRAAFDESEWGRAHADGLGIWITPMYRLASRRLEIITVGRYLANAREYDGRDLADLGIRVGRDIGKASLSAEYVWRTDLGDRVALVGSSEPAKGYTSSRWAALFTCPLGSKLQAVASFGSDFRRPAGERPVIATIGLNLGFGAVMLMPSRSKVGL
ncbi:MAG: hypothetical protein ABI681_04495 [Gemmatimonadales bacterium]